MPMAKPTEKQKLRAYYGVLERQFKGYVDKAMKSSNIAGEELVQILECRLDNMVYRMGFGKSIREARQMVNHGHMLVNGKKVTIPSYIIKVGDTITLKDSSKKIDKFSDQFSDLPSQFSYIEKNFEALEGKLLTLPARELIPIEVNEQLVIEYYSRR